MNRERGTDEVGDAEQLASNENVGEGKKLSILAFRGAFHGRTFGCISCTNTRGRIKVAFRMLSSYLIQILGRRTHFGLPIRRFPPDEISP